MSLYVYQVVLHDTDPNPRKHWYALHQIFRSLDGRISWTKDSVPFIADFDQPGGIKLELTRALAAVYANPVLRESELLKQVSPPRGDQGDVAKSRFPHFDVNVPMPQDTAVPGSYRGPDSPGPL